MKNQFATSLLLLAYCLVMAPATSAPLYDLTITVSGIRQAGGTIQAVLCTKSEDFPNNCKVRNVTKATAGNTVLVFKAVPAETYAFAAFHDKNGNGKLDMAGGMPSEGLAFSRDAMGSQGVPGFADSAFRIVQNSQLKVTMRYVGRP